MTDHSTDCGKCIEVCNNFICGEIAAVEIYKLVLEKHAENPEVRTLRQIYRDHQDAVMQLGESVTSMGGTPATEAGEWGGHDMSAQNPTGLPEGDSALTALLEAEERSLDAYRDALHSSELGWSCKDLIRRDLLRMAEDHIDQLKHLAKSNDYDLDKDRATPQTR